MISKYIKLEKVAGHRNIFFSLYTKLPDTLLLLLNFCHDQKTTSHSSLFEITFHCS